MRLRNASFIILYTRHIVLHTLAEMRVQTIVTSPWCAHFWFQELSKLSLFPDSVDRKIKMTAINFYWRAAPAWWQRSVYYYSHHCSVRLVCSVRPSLFKDVSWAKPGKMCASDVITLYILYAGCLFKIIITSNEVLTIPTSCARQPYLFYVRNV